MRLFGKQRHVEIKYEVCGNQKALTFQLKHKKLQFKEVLKASSSKTHINTENIELLRTYH
jgi:hypothetical protein